MSVHLDHKPFQMDGLGLDFLERVEDSLAQVFGAFVGQMRLRAFERPVKTLVIEGLKQVVERIHLKGSHRVLIVSGHEDDGGNAVSRKRFQNTKAVDARHLDVQEHKIRHIAGDGSNSLLAVGALADDFNLGVAREHDTKPLARERLIVNNEYANRLRAGHAMPPFIALTHKACRGFQLWEGKFSRNGISNNTVSPPLGVFERSRRWSAPYNCLSRASVFERPTPSFTMAPEPKSSGIPGPLSVT